MNRKYALCTICAFVLAVAFLFVSNIKGSFRSLFEADGGIAQRKAALENYLEESVYGKNHFVGITSIVKNSIGFDIIGNFEFVRDDDRIMQQRWNEKEIATTNFENSVVQLHHTCEAVGDIPMIVVQFPDRGENFIFSDTMNYHGKRYEDLLNSLLQEGIDVLDLSEDPEIREFCKTGAYVFRTDAHLSTEAEFLNAKVVTQYLEKKYSFAFPMTDTVYDSDQYNWVGCPFRGNFVQSCSDQFVETDRFYMFYPVFETDLQMSFDGATIEREGDFSAVMTNNYDPTGLPLYWVTNYGQWPSPLYTYTNHLLPDAPRLLIVCDSTLMRSNVFLTLNASCVTVADPRYFNGIDYLTDLLEHGAYDAVIVGGCSYEFYARSFFP